MNILVIGNGFDLAHGLPTKYTDFLFFCSAVKKILEDNEIEKNIFGWLFFDENVVLKKAICSIILRLIGLKECYKLLKGIEKYMKKC